VTSQSPLLWALDAKLADRRHFPSINWLTSYSLYTDALNDWIKKNVAEEFPAMRTQAMTILQKESELEEIVQLVGPDALPARERVVLDVARMLREDFLQQNAFNEIDTYCSPKKQYRMMKTILSFHEKAMQAVDKGMEPEEISKVSVIDNIAKMKYVPEDKFEEEFNTMLKKIETELKF
jgi:V/A-type H+-transporting ATPase subunit A